MNTYIPRRWSFNCLGVAAAGLICMAPAWAGDFERAYRAALDNDAKYRSDKFTLASGQQAAPIALGALLPQVSASVTETMVSGSQTTDLAAGGSSSTSSGLPRPVPKHQSAGSAYQYGGPGTLQAG